MTEVHIPDLSLSLLFNPIQSFPTSASMIYQETVPVTEAEVVVALWKRCIELLGDGTLKFQRQVE
jgi:hypothetical protein